MSLDFSYKREILRKLFHLSTCIFALMLLYFGKNICIPIFLSITIIFFTLDFLRLKNRRIQKLYNIFFSIVTKNYEENQITSASYVFLSLIIVTIVFEVQIASAALLIMSLSDPIASLIGRAYGEFDIFGKSLEGSIAFFIISVIILYSFNFPSDTVLYVSVLSTLVELFSDRFHVDDNLSVPIAASILLFIF